MFRNPFHVVIFAVIFVLGFTAGIFSGDLLFDRYIDDDLTINLHMSEYLREAN